MTPASEDKGSGKVPLLSNAAAGGATGIGCILITSWGGHLPYIDGDFSSLKAFLFFILPSLGMYLSYLIKSIGFKWSLGTVNRTLLRLNKKKQKELGKDIKKYKGVFSEEKINDLKKQLEQAVQDKHDIISNDYDHMIERRKAVRENYKAHQDSQPNENSELQAILNDQKQSK
ncbi:hypothetical protein PWF83_19055 [Pantoea dispersa]|uniref:hypothetical protein n=1 Tax=Pantoea dispersa TaxID=59814 RepID=UPI0023A9C27C|nr:hypothetical protein [Pantoea dispersa]WEA05761.1 hypothetical protein PWF83_19055 [Pantoea dispersa]